MSNLGWTPDAFAFLASCLLFRPLSSRVALAGLRRVFSRARISESRAAYERGDPELEEFLLGEETRRFYFLRSWRFVSLLSLREELNVTDTISAFFFCSSRFDISALLMLPLSPDSLALRVAIGPLRPPRSCLTRWLPSLAPLSSRVDYTRLLGVSRRPWHQIVGCPGDLVFYNLARHLFSPVEWNEGCWRV